MVKRNCLTWREFLGEDFYKKILLDYEAIRVFRKNIKGKPTDEQRARLLMDKEFEAFYKRIMD